MSEIQQIAKDKKARRSLNIAFLLAESMEFSNQVLDECVLRLDAKHHQGYALENPILLSSCMNAVMQYISIAYPNLIEELDEEHVS